MRPIDQVFGFIKIFVFITLCDVANISNIYIYITNISHITQSDKDKNFDKTKDLVNWSHKKVTYDLPKTSLHS